MQGSSGPMLEARLTYAVNPADDGVLLCFVLSPFALLGYYGIGGLLSAIKTEGHRRHLPRSH